MPARTATLDWPDLPDQDQMSVKEFLGFTSSRPDEEKWELIEGLPVMQAAPSTPHQTIVTNIILILGAERKRLKASWRPIPGIGTLSRLPKPSLPQPDVMVLGAGAAIDYSNTTDNAPVLFEILSRSNTKADQAWRRKAYASVPICQHYVTIDQKRVQIVRYDRNTGWQPVEIVEIVATLDLPALGARLPISEIYADTPLAKTGKA